MNVNGISFFFLSYLDPVHMRSCGKSAAYLISEVEFLVGFFFFLMLPKQTMTQAASSEVSMHKTCIHIWAHVSNSKGN